MTREEFIDRFFHVRSIHDPNYAADSAMFSWDEFKEIITRHILPLEYLPWLVRVEFLRLTKQNAAQFYTVENQEDVFGIQRVLSPWGFETYQWKTYCYGSFAEYNDMKTRIWEELKDDLRVIEDLIALTMKKYLGSAFSEPRVLLSLYRHTEKERRKVLKEFGRKVPPLGDPYAIEVEVKPRD